MTKQIIPNGKKGLAKWDTRDLLVTAVISIVFAALLLGVNYLFVMPIRPLGPLAMYAVTGIWVIPPIFIVYILRRPGAVLLSQLMMSIISVPFSPFGWMELMLIPLIGVPIELVFFATRYRNYRLPILVIGGIASGIVNLAVFWVPVGMSLLAMEIQIAIVLVTIVSGAVGGWAAKLLADAVAKTGVLSSYAVGQEQQEEV